MHLDDRGPPAVEAPQRGSGHLEAQAAALDPGALTLDRQQAPANPTAADLHLVADDTPHEISLLGLRVKEAVAQLEGFLDHAVRAGYPSVRIIHGIGSGALRRAVEQYLSTSPYCAGFRSGEPREGGAGVTVAQLAAG